MTKVDETLFKGEHYLGRPADSTDKIITRRVGLVKAIPGFCDKNLELLEIGAGNGATLLLMSDEMKSCMGVDIFDHTAEFRNTRDAKGITNCDIVIRDIEKEDLDKKYDRLICFEVIEHFNSEETVKRFTRWLKPGALCAISVPNKWWVFETHGARLPLLPWNRVPFFSWLPKFIHERFANARIYTKSRIKKLLENSGFEVLEMKYITAPMDVLKEGKLKRFLVNNIFNTETTAAPVLSTSIFIVARVK
ncbi:MAG: class I SAM-dependent methyltransferase [Chitinophagales bacterium]